MKAKEVRKIADEYNSKQFANYCRILRHVETRASRGFYELDDAYLIINSDIQFLDSLGYKISYKKKFDDDYSKIKVSWR